MESTRYALPCGWSRRGQFQSPFKHEGSSLFESVRIDCIVAVGAVELRPNQQPLVPNGVHHGISPNCMLGWRRHV